MQHYYIPSFCFFFFFFFFTSPLRGWYIALDRPFLHFDYRVEGDAMMEGWRWLGWAGGDFYWITYVYA